MSTSPRQENAIFESEVQRVARALWPSAEYDGASKVDGREIDGIFATEENIHVLEATVSAKVYKAENDVEKLCKTISKIKKSNPTRAVVGWFITKGEPTADQREISKKILAKNKHQYHVNIMSFSSFQARLIDAKSYLSARDNYKFGSVRDPATGKSSDTIAYVSIDLIDSDSRKLYSMNEVCENLRGGRVIVLLGDYGAGKSMTLREVYRELKKSHYRGDTSEFPVYLNLASHYGQTDAAEVLTRHATSIGFSSSHHLVRAWRAGYVHLLIDGFDEVSTIAIQGMWRNLRQHRYRSMEAARKLINEHPAGPGLMIAGRSHYFDNVNERRSALGILNDTIELSLNEFSEKQIDSYLRRQGHLGPIPSWLPSRPLLLGYLAARDVLTELLGNSAEATQLAPASGWNILLDRIAAREAEIEAGIDGDTVREILERLATVSRSSGSDMAPLSQEALVNAYTEVCGYSPDDRGLVLLQRLPGLGVDREEESSRTFIDESFVDACKAGDVVRFIENPYNFPSSSINEIESSVDEIGIDIVSLKAKKKRYNRGKLNTALRQAKQIGSDHLAIDIIRVMLELEVDVDEFSCFQGLMIRNFNLPSTNSDFSRIEFKDCFFSRVEVDSDVRVDGLPIFSECYIEELEGRVSKADLPANFDANCVIARFVDELETSADVLASTTLDLGCKVCLTILKKLYERRGSGRRQNALFRGLDARARVLVPKVLQILYAEDLAYPDKSRRETIWRPNRMNRARVGQILTAPNSCGDGVLDQCSQLSS
ncbi:MAG: NACHT domain-containing protein [Bryobacterales bacterium]|nr:NACHT domain-containing protein [Bryobacterales bacterium]